MCQICMQTICPAGCPNAEDDKPVHKCAECEGDIWYGQRYFNSYKGPVCYSCLKEKTVLELAELFEVELEKAE